MPCILFIFGQNENNFNFERLKSAHIRKPIVRFLQAMNVKYEETAKKAIKHRCELMQRNKQEASVHLQAYELIVNSDKHKALNPMAKSYDELVEKSKSEIEEEPEIKWNQPYTGAEGTKVHTMLPWPPNSTNLEAFKNLLLTRKMLIMQAGGLYADGKVEVFKEGDGGENDNSGNSDDDDDEERNSIDVNQVVTTGTTMESNESHHIAIVPQENTDGPIVIRNQMDIPVNVMIKTEGSVTNSQDTQECEQSEIICSKSNTTNLSANNSTEVHSMELVPDVDSVATLTNNTETTFTTTDDSGTTSGLDTNESSDASVVIQPQPSTSQESLDSEDNIKEVNQT